ncbi:hypothetical protein AHAS_Ahas07G0113900 [Arachis hypogaea]
MKYVYDYMLHLLKQYAKLQRFKPKIPQGVKEMYSERMTCCLHNSPRKRYMYESFVRSPSSTLPCMKCCLCWMKCCMNPLKILIWLNIENIDTLCLCFKLY